MSSIEQKFAKLGTDHAPGQEVRQADDQADTPLRGDLLPGVPVDFSHGDVNETAFGPVPGALEEFVDGVRRGGPQAYTEYRGGKREVRDRLAEKLAAFTGRPVSSQRELIITPGTQGALFLAIGATVAAGDRVAIVRPDYFANRKLVEFLGAEIAPVRLDYLGHTDRAGLDLEQLEAVFKSGVKTFLFSNLNNPAGAIYSAGEIARIGELSRPVRRPRSSSTSSIRACCIRARPTRICVRRRADADRIVTIMGPSKTESLSGYRLGVAFGAAHLIDRMEKLQAIVVAAGAGADSERAPGWFRSRPAGWPSARRSTRPFATISSAPSGACRVSRSGRPRRAAISSRVCRGSRCRCINSCFPCAARRPAAVIAWY